VCRGVGIWKQTSLSCFPMPMCSLIMRDILVQLHLITPFLPRCILLLHAVHAERCTCCRTTNLNLVFHLFPLFTMHRRTCIETTSHLLALRKSSPAWESHTQVELSCCHTTPYPRWVGGGLIVLDIIMVGGGKALWLVYLILLCWVEFPFHTNPLNSLLSPLPFIQLPVCLSRHFDPPLTPGVGLWWRVWAAWWVC
jgi:hypothetical protein